MRNHYSSQILALIAVIAALGVLLGCATSKAEMAWVRTDGRRIADDQALLKQGQADIAFCHANLDATAASEAARECMSQKGYALVPKDQAEEARARYAAATAQRGVSPAGQ
jgi:hypothetical protein